MNKMKPIPISAGRQIAEVYGYDQVVIVARRVGEGEHCTTYGVDKANCDVAARIGDFFKHELMKWPRKSEHNDKGHQGGITGDPSSGVQTAERKA